jgi:Uma2 family endonuclease
MSLLAEKERFRPRPKRWAKAEYAALVERGVLRGQHVYLYRGELIEVAPMGSAHLIALNRVNLWACQNFCPPFMVMCQSPFETPGESVPEPDVAVLSEADFCRKPQPNRAMLIIEVSDSSLAMDREKAMDYAAAGVAEYWIVDVVNRQILVHRDPLADSSQPLGWRYETMRTLAAEQMIAPLLIPAASVCADMFMIGI